MQGAQGVIKLKGVAATHTPHTLSFRVSNFSPEWTGRKIRLPKPFLNCAWNAFTLLAAHALSLSPHDARRATDADPVSGPGIDDTVTSRPVDLYHARPRSLDGSDARPDKAGASGVLTCSHSPSLVFTPPRADPGAHSHYSCAPSRLDGTGISVPPQSRCVF